MDYLSLIKQPIEGDLDDFNNLFNSSLSHTDGLLSQALAYIRQRTGKRMRPMLILLMARNFGDVTDVTQTWWHLLCQKRGFKLDTNNSYSGATIPALIHI